MPLKNDLNIHKTVEIMVYLNFLLVDARIRIRSRRYTLHSGKKLSLLLYNLYLFEMDTDLDQQALDANPDPDPPK
jgi:hypothetical protein